MSKKVMNSTKDKEPTSLSRKDEKTLTNQYKQVIFTPTSAMEKVKAQFWTRFVPGPFADKDSLSVFDVMEVVKTSKVKNWWSEPGFLDWFMNRQEEKETIKYLFNKGLSTLERILDNPEANANAQINAIKILAEMNGFLVKGGSNQPKFADESLNNMSAKELEGMLEKQALDYIKAKGIKVVEEKVIETSVTKKKEEDNDEG